MTWSGRMKGRALKLPLGEVDIHTDDTTRRRRVPPPKERIGAVAARRKGAIIGQDFHEG